MLKYCHMSNEIVGARIRRLRERKGWSMSELARHVGTRHGHISQIEAGKITAGYDVIALIAAQLEVSVDFLIGQANIHDEKEGDDLDEMMRLYADRVPPDEARRILEMMSRLNHERRLQWLTFFEQWFDSQEQAK